MATQNQNLENMEIDRKINPSIMERGSSFVEQQYSPITATSGWDDPLPSNPPAPRGIVPPNERVIVRMEEAPFYPNSSIRRFHVKVSY